MMRIRRGSALIIAIVLLSIILGASISLVSYTTLSNKTTTSIDYYTEARHIAEAGLEKALWCIRQSVGTNCGGTYGTNYAGESDIPFSSGVFTVTVTTIDASTKKVESVGYIPNAVSPKKKVTVRTNIEINAQGVGLFYAMQVGTGGIDMDNNSKITGSVFAAGSITGKGGNDQSTISGDVKVARTIVLTKDQERNVYNTDLIFGKTNTTQRYLAQSFVATTSSLANFVSLYIKKVSTPDDLNIWLARDNNGEPLASMEQVGTIDASTISTNYAWIQADIANRPIIQGKTYWIVIGPSGSSATKYYTIGFDNTNGYINGATFASPSKATGSWVAQNGDINFALYLGGVDTTITNVAVNGNADASTIQSSTIGGVAKTKTLIDDTTVTSSAYSTTISNSTIKGNAYANTITHSTVTGSQNPGTGIDPPYQVDFPFTFEQINQWKANATAANIRNSDYTLPHDQSDTLAAQKIIGNVSIGNKAILTLSGVLYITGNLTLSENAKIQLDQSYGSLSGVIIVDGTVTTDQGVTFKGTGQAGSYLLVASLAQDDGTYNGPAISIDNGTSGVIFFAPYGLISLSEGASAKEITALKIKLQENAKITYDSGLASAEFSTGPQAGWAVVPGTFQEIK